ncbi:MAG: hypothetical protein Q9195_008077 [Heterodermia aff. obscurata]
MTNVDVSGAPPLAPAILVALKEYEARILASVVELEGCIERAAASGKPVNVNSLFYWFAFDVMGKFAFAESFGMLENEQFHHIILMLRRALKLLGPFSPVLWLARIGLTLFPRSWRMADWNNMMAYCREKMDQRIKMEVDQPDISSYLIDDARKNGFTPADKKYLNGDAVTVIIAGRHDLPHLSAVIDETLRLYPPLPTAVTRETPPEGEKYFVKADEFIPERWYSKPEMVKDRRAHVPFSVGKSNCIGKNLALMDIKLVIASILKKYHIHFDPREDGHRVFTELQDHFTATPGPLSLVFKDRDD